MYIIIMMIDILPVWDLIQIVFFCHEFPGFYFLNDPDRCHGVYPHIGHSHPGNTQTTPRCDSPCLGHGAQLPSVRMYSCFV